MTGLRQVAKDQQGTGLSLAISGNSVSTPLPAHLMWTKKKGCVDDRQETDSVSAVSREGETTKSRSNTIDWFEYRGTPQ